VLRQHYYGEKSGPRQRLGEPIQGIPLDPGTRQKPAIAKPLPAPGTGGGIRTAQTAAADPDGVGVVLGDPPEPALGAVAPSATAATSEVQQLKQLVVRLEKTITAQGRAFRALVEIMQEKGVVRRGELGQRTTREKKP
jgi:hypothetical protein